MSHTNQYLVRGALHALGFVAAFVAIGILMFGVVL
jgi:hypothetical protein